MTGASTGAGLRNPTGAQLRSLSPEELARFGEEALRQHLVDTAIAAHLRHGPVEEHLEALLEDRDFVRYPLRIAHSLGTLARHQFAQPEPEDDGWTLFVHPALANDRESTARAAVYFLPLINYGAFINDDHCLTWGATLLGLTIDDYYRFLCHLADRIGALPRDRRQVGDRF